MAKTMMMMTNSTPRARNRRHDNDDDGDDNEPREVKKMLNDFKEQTAPLVQQMAAFATEAARQLAADMGEAPTNDNSMFWGTMGNLLTFGWRRLNSGSAALHALHDLASSEPSRNASQWSAAMWKCGELSTI